MGPSTVNGTQAPPSAQPSPSRGKDKAVVTAEDSETEDDEDDEELLLASTKKPGTPAPPPRNVPPLPTPARSLSPEVDRGRAPGRIIGTTYPLADFKKNLAQGDIVTKAVEDLGVVIAGVVMRPFSSRRTKELLECMEAMRDTSLKVS